jgi:hypothetical protein
MIEAKIQLPEIPDKVKERLTMFKEIAVTTMSEVSFYISLFFLYKKSYPRF